MMKFKQIFRSVGVFFLCTMCVLLSACAGGWNLDDLDEEDLEDLEDFQLGLSMDNVKVLRRSYGEDKATISAVNNTYYDQYIENIIKYLSSIYGVVNDYYIDHTYSDVFQEIASSTMVSYDQETQELLNSLQTDFANGADYFKYFYDAIRYQIVEVTTYYRPLYKNTATGKYSNTEQEGYIENTDDVFVSAPSGLTQEDFVNNSAVASYKVVADNSKSWNWSLNYKLQSEDASTRSHAFVYEYAVVYKEEPETSVIAGNKITAQIDSVDFSYNSGVRDFKKYYDDEFLAFGMSFDSSFYSSSLYSDVSQTEFEQALSFVLYSIVNNVAIDEIPTITVTKGLNGSEFVVEGYDSVTSALQAAKSVYIDKASYIGLTESDKAAMVEYLLKYVIGETAIEQSKKVGSMQNLYYEKLVPAIVEYCTSLTSTSTSVYGPTDQEVIEGTAFEGQLKDPTYIGGQYLSSDIVDYEYTSSYVNMEGVGLDEFAHLGEYEYQSMMLMPTISGKIDEIWIDFGYLGNGGQNDKITIMTYIRCYKGGGEFDIYSKSIEVTENTVDVGEDGTTLVFKFKDLNSDGYVECDKIEFNNAINSTYYQQRIKNTWPLRDFSRSIVIGPANLARNYYSLIEGEYRDYGVFNHETLRGTDYYNSKYVEVAFEVMDATCDNYKFLCGFSMITEFEEKDLSNFK